jgi:hypothetical protein
MSPRRPDPPFRLEAQSKGYLGPGPGDWSPPVPAGIFLDSSIVVYLETYGEQIWDNVAPDPALPAQQRRQIEALRVLMALADRAGLAFAVSPEVARQTGGRYVADIAAHWQEARLAWGIEDRGLAPMTVVATLPSRDQLVLAEAYRSGCEVVLTNDSSGSGPGTDEPSRPSEWRRTRQRLSTRSSGPGSRCGCRRAPTVL